jgi:hypothetical protein
MSRALVVCRLSGALSAAAGRAQAQIGSGWTRFSPASFLDFQCGGKHTHFPVANKTFNGAVYTISSGLETFKLTSTACTRIERRAEEHYTSGKRQMQGDLRFNDISQQCVHQLFHGSSGPFFLVSGYQANGGELRKYAGPTILASRAYGIWLRYNNLHTVGSSLQIYINGTRKYSGGGAARDGSGNNNKYGLYGSKRTSAPTVNWRNVTWYR